VQAVDLLLDQLVNAFGSHKAGGKGVVLGDGALYFQGPIQRIRQHLVGQVVRRTRTSHGGAQIG
jgi:hypothetical protein